MSILLAVLAQGAITSTPQQAASLKGQPSRYCRLLVVGASRSGDLAICRTKAEWADWDSCAGPTRYCSPEQKAAIRSKYTSFALNEDSRIVCRVLQLTGSRLRSKMACLPQREWQRMWDNGSETTHSLQDNYSKRDPSIDR